jgi:hypothetical protein
MKKINIFALILLFTQMPVHASESCKSKINVDTKTRVYRCDDNSVSFQQATFSNLSAKKSNYNGLCGATAASNVFHAYCQNLFIEPTEIGTKYFDDYTPGIRPDTMESGLNRLFSNNSECLNGEWKYYYSTNRYDFIQSLKIEVRKKNSYLTRKISDKQTAPRSPVIVLLSTTGGEILHYVTVVDVTGFKGGLDLNGCRVIYNDFGDQTSATCDDFSSYANQVDDTVLTSFLPEYVHLVFKQ